MILLTCFTLNYLCSLLLDSNMNLLHTWSTKMSQVFSGLLFPHGLNCPFSFDLHPQIQQYHFWYKMAAM